MEIFLVRHTTLLNTEGICYGASDLEVASTFSAEAKVTFSKIPPEKKYRVFASPLSRCVNLASYYSKDFTRDERLKELNFGSWELKKWSDLEPDSLDKWMKDFVNQPCPDGESFLQLQERMVDFWEDIIIGGSQDTIIVSHGGPIRAILCHLLEIPMKNAFNLHLDFGGVSRVEINQQRLRVSYINR